MHLETFRTRTQWPIICMFGLFAAHGAASVIWHFTVAPKSTFSLTLSTIQLVGCLPCLMLALFQKLSLTDADVVLQNGPFRQRVPVNSIRHVRSVDWRGDSIQASTHSFELKYGPSDSIRVAPIEREAFIEALRVRNPAILFTA